MKKVFVTIIAVWNAWREVTKARRVAAKETTVALVATVNALNGNTVQP